MLPPPGFLLQAVAYGLLVPAAVALAVLLLVRRWGAWRGGEAPRGADALAAGAGLVAGFVALAASGHLDWDFLKPTDASDWLLPLAVLAAAAGLVECIAPWPLAARWGARLVVAALTARLLVRAEAAFQPVNPWWHAGLGLAVLGLWELLDRLARRWPGAGPPALLAVVALAAAAVLESAGSLGFAQMAGVLAAVLVGCAGAAWAYPGDSPARGAVPVVAVMLTGLLFVGFFETYSDVPPASFLLVLAAPLGLGALAALPFPKLQGLPFRVVSSGVTLLLAGLAVTLAALAS